MGWLGCFALVRSPFACWIDPEIPEGPVLGMTHGEGTAQPEGILTHELWEEGLIRAYGLELPPMGHVP